MAYNPISKTVDTIEELRTVTGKDKSVVFITNFGNDNELVPAIWDNTSIEADNGTTVIQRTGVSVGRWLVKPAILQEIITNMSRVNNAAYWQKVKNGENVTIIWRGGSATYGLDRSSTGTLPAINGAPSNRTRNPVNPVDVLEDVLNECLLTSTVINQGYPYDRTRNAIERWKDDNTEADAIIIEYGTNDALNLGGYSGDPVTLEEFKNNLTKIVIEHILTGKRVILELSPLQQPTFTLPSPGLQSQNYIIRQYYKIVRDVADRFGIEILDTDRMTQFMTNRFILDNGVSAYSNLAPKVAGWIGQSVAGTFLTAEPIEAEAGSRFIYQHMAAAARGIFAGSIPTSRANGKAILLYPEQTCSLTLDVKTRCRLVFRGMINSSPTRSIDVVVGQGIYTPIATVSIPMSGSWEPRYTDTGIVLEPGLNMVMLRNTSEVNVYIDEIWCRSPKDDSVESLNKRVITDTDADLDFEDRFVILEGDLTADRTLTKHSGAGFEGEKIFIHNRNNSEFTWYCDRMVDASGNTVTTLPNNSVTVLQSDGGSNWVIISQEIERILNFDAEATLSINEGNSVSINAIKTRLLNGDDPMIGTMGSIAFPFTFTGVQTGWPFPDGSGFQVERRHSDTSRSGYRIFTNANQPNKLYYQEKIVGDLTTWGDPVEIGLHSQIYTKLQADARFMGTAFNEASNLGNYQVVNLNEAVGARVFRVDSNVTGLPDEVAGVNPCVIFNLYGPHDPDNPGLTDCPQLCMAMSGANMSDKIFFRPTRTSTWVKLLTTAMEVNDPRTSWPTNSDLNTAYPNAPLGFKVFCKDITGGGGMFRYEGGGEWWYIQYTKL